MNIEALYKTAITLVIICLFGFVSVINIQIATIITATIAVMVIVTFMVYLIYKFWEFDSIKKEEDEFWNKALKVSSESVRKIEVKK